MIDLKTKYAGIDLKNPVIIGSCNLTSDTGIIKQLEAAGSGAIVYKSLFEEQIQLERYELDERRQEYNERHAEMISIHPDIEHAGPKEHLGKLREVKKITEIPVIASLNAVNTETWLEYAMQIEKTGVDGLEINFYSVPKDFKTESYDIENDQIDILKKLKERMKIPVIVKLSPFYANPLNVVKKFDDAGADAVVLFNKLFQPEINIDLEKHNTPLNFSNQEDNKLSLRFAGLLHKNISADICANTGIHNGNDLIAMILAGADCVQIVSTVYENGAGRITEILSDIKEWMIKHNYRSLDDFRGKLSDYQLNDPFIYRRAQYVDILMNSENLLKKKTVI